MSRLKITAIGSTLGLLVAGGLVTGLAGPAAADSVHHGQHAGSSDHVTQASDSATEASGPSGQDGMNGHDWMTHRHFLLNAKLAPSVPTDPAIFGVSPGKVPWVLKSGWVRLTPSGQVAVRVVGLIVPAKQSNPVPGIAATVYCGGTMAGQTTPVAFPSSGTVTFHGSVPLPAFCPAPAVLLNPANPATSPLPAYIAFDGQA